ncbi:MAG: hypothetical protein FWD61_05340 [Phycisphaerales bacterium]|nr:hypothetical protein [Phycisphaerales bacterium]
MSSSADKSKVQGMDPAFVIMFTTVVVAVAMSMTLRLVVSGIGPSKARGNDVAVEHHVPSDQTHTPLTPESE